MSERKPWRVWATDSFFNVLNGTGGIVARCWGNDIAAQIVREHNAHDDLVAALQKLVGVAGLVPIFQVGDGREALQAGIAAIAKVKPV